MNGYNVYDENCKENYTYEEDFHPNDYWSHYNSTWDDTPTTSHSSTWDLTPTASRNPLSKMVLLLYLHVCTWLNMHSKLIVNTIIGKQKIGV